MSCSLHKHHGCMEDCTQLEIKKQLMHSVSRAFTPTTPAISYNYRVREVQLIFYLFLPQQQLILHMYDKYIALL